MSDSQPYVSTILVLSKHKGCRIMEKNLQNNKFRCIFSTNLSQPTNENIDFLIINDNDLKQFNSNTKYRTIVLKDTQKNDASILANSGQLSTFGQNQEYQFVPSYLIDFIVGISLSILILQMKNSIHKTKGQYKISVSIIDLVHYFGSFNISAKQNGLLANPLGKNMLDGGTPFYRLYKCKEGIIAVGNLEPKFYQQMIKALKVDSQTQSYLSKNQFSTDEWNRITQLLNQKFMEKSASEWHKIMSDYDTCVTQVVSKPQSIPSIQPKIYSLKQSKL